MATRLSLPHIQPSYEIRPRIAAWREAADRPPMTRQERWQLLWRILWLPYWLGSDVAAPRLPTRDAPVQAAGLAGEQVARMTTQIARRVWLQRALTIIARACWLGVLAGCGWLVVELAGGPALDVDALIVLAVAFAIPGVILACLSRPTRCQVARMLDRSFTLHERVSTAVENLGRAVPRDGERASVVYLQMADAANVVTELRRHAAFRVRPPVREIVLAVAVGLLLASLYFLRGVGGVIPDAGSAAVPRFVPAIERFEQQAEAAAQAAAEVDPATVPTVAEVEETAQRSNEARRDLEQLGEALNDHSVTRAAAEAIEQGDYETAASELRDLSERTGDLSPSAREGLAQDLEEAASQMSEGSQELAEATNQAADGLRQGDASAQDGVRELGDEVERTGEQVVPQQELNQRMEQAQATHGDSPPSGGASDAAQQDPSGQQADQSGQEGQPADQAGAQGQQQPGSGADAQPGEGQQASSGQQGASAQEPVDGQQSGDQAQGGGEGDQAGNPEQPGGQPGGPEGAGGQPGDEQGSATGVEEAQSEQGAGAGSGSGQPATDDPSAAGQQETGAGGEGPPAEENVSAQQPAEGEGQDPAADGSSSLQLNEGPDGGSIRTSENGGSSLPGSGAGATAGSGATVQGEVDEAGPDSNRVPPAYRGIVEDYFSDPDGDS
ncbi:MAG: hypothetical protein ACRDJH_05890 [Thermomicrobiales bacterium]